jgi:hypothetical protein
MKNKEKRLLKRVPVIRRVQLPKGLTNKRALARALQKSPGDFRGFTYDRRTGRATLV